MSRFIAFVLGIFLFVSGDTLLGQSDSNAGYYPNGGPDNTVPVSLIQLIANPQTYNNKRVQIIGFLHLEFEGDVIYLHKEDFQFGLTKNGLWIDVPKDMTKEQMKTLNDQYVICSARFVAGMHGHMGLNSGELTDISRLELWSRVPTPLQK